jgi:hypothetical protein
VWILQVKLTHSLVQATVANKVSIAAAIKGVEINGGTNLSGGLFQGISVQLQSQSIPNVVNSSSTAVTAAAAAPKEPAPTSETPTLAGDWDMVEWANDASASVTTVASPKTVRCVFLFTDGCPTDGVKDAGMMEGCIKNLIASKARGSDLKIHSFGFGSDHDPVLLQAISNAGKGTYYYVATEENIAEAFADALGGLLSAVAQNVELRLTPASTCTVSAPDNDHSERRDGSDLIISVQDLYAEEAKDVVVRVEMPAVEGAIESALVATVCVTYVDIVNGMPVERSLPLSLRRDDSPLPMPAANERVLLHRARLATAAAMQDAIALADAGCNAEAHARLVRQMAELEALMKSLSMVETPVSTCSSFSGSNAIIALRRDLETCAEQVKLSHVYHCSGKAYVRVVHRSHAVQRSNALRAPPSPVLQGDTSQPLCQTFGMKNCSLRAHRLTYALAPMEDAAAQPSMAFHAPAPRVLPVGLYANACQARLVRESDDIE